jgi:hypothetical protein
LSSSISQAVKPLWGESFLNSLRVWHSLCIAGLLAGGLVMGACTRIIKPVRPFSAKSAGLAPDYADSSSWAARPAQRSLASARPAGSYFQQEVADTTADVFFIHRTTYFYQFGYWNARLDNQRLNRYTDNTTIRQQASVFNTAGRLYAPRYRQATLYSFFEPSGPANGQPTAEGQQALDLAYADVKAAFQYYLAHYNHGRPIILAGHSQGTYHATRLLHEFFDKDPQLCRQLVAAYLVGFRARPDEFQTLRPCADSLQTGCYVGWNAALQGHDYAPYHGLLATNPLTWTLDTLLAPAALNRGGVPRQLSRLDVQPTTAQAHDGLLWVQAPAVGGYQRLHIPGQRPLRFSYHLADYGLFYLNVRRNARARVQAWQKKQE